MASDAPLVAGSGSFLAAGGVWEARLPLTFRNGRPLLGYARNGGFYHQAVHDAFECEERMGEASRVCYQR